MNKVLYLLVGFTGFVTGQYMLILMIPLLWWIFKDEKKVKKVERRRISGEYVPINRGKSFSLLTKFIK